MAEGFSTVFVSGDLGQALALDEGQALLFDGATTSEATTSEINMFFDTALDLVAIEGEQRAALDSEGLAELVRRETAKADTLRFLLFGMDGALSDGLRLSSIELASSMIGDVGIAEHIQERFLKVADPDCWDSRSAAMLATLIDADLPALLYLAAGDPEILESLKALDAAQLLTRDARPQVRRSLLVDPSSGRSRPFWDAAADCLGRERAAGQADLGASDWFVERFRSIELPGMQAQVVRAMIHSAAISYQERGDAPSSLDMLDDAMGRALLLRHKGSKTIACIAMTCKAELLARLGRVAEAMKVNARAVDIVAAPPGGLARYWKGMARLALAGNHHALGNLGKAVDQYAQLLAEFGGVDSAQIRTLSAKARYNQAVALLELGRFGEAREIFRQAAQMAGPEHEVGLRLLEAKALYNAAWTSGRLGEPEAALMLYRSAINACDGIESAEGAAIVQNSLYNLGTVFAGVGAHDEAIFAYDRVIAGARDDENRRLLLAQAMFNRALSLEALSRALEAGTGYLMVEALFASLRSARRIVVKARARRAALELGLAAHAVEAEEAPIEAEAEAVEWRSDTSDDDLGQSES